MVGAIRKGLSSEAITYLVHHVFLPPKLPQEDDSSDEHDKIMINTTLAALLQFKALFPHKRADGIDQVIALVSVSKDVHASASGGIDESKLKDALQLLCKEGKRIRFLHLQSPTDTSQVAP